MKMGVLVTPVRLAIICAFVQAACLLGQDRGGTPPAVGRTQIGGVFSKADASGSLEYWGVCNVKDFYPDFPKLKKISGTKDSVVESLREIFSVDPKMRVTQDADGKIRMIEEDVPSDLLDVRINHVRFPVEYHGPNAAVGAILKTPEVMAFRREHNIGPHADLGDIFGYPSETYAPERPRVKGDLHDVTVREALDYVLLTFHGFWLYENCKGPREGRIVFFAFFENEPKAAPVQTQK
jgi:hypothetical protein